MFSFNLNLRPPLCNMTLKAIVSECHVLINSTTCPEGVYTLSFSLSLSLSNIFKLQALYQILFIKGTKQIANSFFS